MCRPILIVLLLLFLGVGIQAGVAHSPADEGIHIDLPSNGQLRVENQFGDINIRVGKERDVSELEWIRRGNGESVPKFRVAPVSIAHLLL